jgi:HTH-type transcriptional regulator / antitoxin HipB
MQRVYLLVPREDNAEVHSLGAEWDAASKRRSVESDGAPEKFSRWLPSPDAGLGHDEEFAITSNEAFVAASAAHCQQCGADIEVICIHCRSGTVSGGGYPCPCPRQGTFLACPLKRPCTFKGTNHSMSPMKDIRLRNAEQLGRAVRLKRQEKGLSQGTLAAQLGVGRKWVLHLESGNPKAELGLVLKVLDALDLRASLGEETPPSSDKDSRVSGPSRLDEVFRRLQRPERK